ncbi:adult cuticle protein 1-like [Stomoxys calcitrans]|uniref:adult cuticle protein 1-like n=1 Tax=Stomoxys calcitrans TaxID=35570 RepID=UPI0027E3AFBE|nr:adult cuticle protein 1-like [Stomoxys calcitrans]
MKFAFAVVLLALAVGVQSSGWGGPWGGPWVGAWGAHGAWGGPWAGPWGGHAAVDLSAHAPWGLAGHGAWGGYPGISLSQGPGHAHAAHGPGVYVAKTRGAVHTAPLAGHVNSATSVNVAPAPGTH